MFTVAATLFFLFETYAPLDAKIAVFIFVCYTEEISLLCKHGHLPFTNGAEVYMRALKTGMSKEEAFIIARGY